MTDVPTKIVTAYPIRYEAFGNQGVLILNKNTALFRDENGKRSNGGLEFVVYRYGVKNAFYHLPEDDGIYGEIVSYQGISYLVNVYLIMPVQGRTQYRKVEQFPDFETALKFMKDAIAEFHGKIKEVET